MILKLGKFIKLSNYSLVQFKKLKIQLILVDKFHKPRLNFLILNLCYFDKPLVY